MKMLMKWKLIAVFLIIGMALGGWWRWQHPASGPASANGRITAISGPELVNHIRALKSPLVLINFWASWCTPCKIEFPALLKMKQQWASRGLQVVFVSIDEPPDLPAAEEFLINSGVEFATYYKGEQPNEFIRELFPKWQGSVPATLLYGQDGQLVDAWEGETSPAEFENRVSKHLKGS